MGDSAIGMDTSIIPLSRFPGFFQVSTTDFFFPLIEDPYIQGKIACANVLSDLYAAGIVHCDNLLMLLCVSTKMSPEERDVVASLMMRGFSDLAREGETRVTGGQTTVNAWPLIGGVAMTVAKEEDLIRPENAVAGDVLVLTKPLGTQLAVNVHQWMDTAHARWSKLSTWMTREMALDAYQKAMKSMARLNRKGAELMHKYGAHAATDITGFGYLGHAQNLAGNQKAMVDFVLEVMPIFKDMKRADEETQVFHLMQGTSAETSGGLLICLPSEEAAQAFCKEIEETDGAPAWIVGKVVEGVRKARIVETPKIIEV